MQKEERKINEREEIKIDDYTPEKGSGASSNVGNKRVVKDNTKLIIALVLLVVIVLMATFDAHWGVIMITAMVEGFLIYKLTNSIV